MADKTLNIKGELLSLAKPLVMGILNVTPDSFYAASRKQTETAIEERIQTILREGGKIIDLGGYSSRPDAEEVSAEEEMNRLSFALEKINRHYPDLIISVDTFRAEVARQCVEKYGVAIINDISGGQIDPLMFSTVAQLQVPYILMHMLGTPQTMQEYTQYTDMQEEIMLYFAEKVRQLHQLGVKDIILDPGFGFSKTTDQNYELMSNLKEFQAFNLPLLVGISRKSMLYKFLGGTPTESLNGTTVLHTYSLLNGANILRVHDVKEAVEAVTLVEKLTVNE
ncbi:dihydropteroate synthase [Parabacteroides sp. 52]|uniref:dihydropteroate synthase n=1 Tax=unclassified Parabacteroides TaxID=2649774 RepID=UPI0013D4B33A|nr:MULTISPECIES: dihydropteroate synthase [unclassified Parabacteroides]MDH6534092.1 dihydropteroate synthase [Parabacteroides sp. PM5-20]NDV55004.1 dihydropteroate synthase [Parabacteroides sp. 52]